MLDEKTTLPSRRTVLKTAAALIGAAAVSNLGPRRAKAAGYPDHPVKIIVPFAPAGPTDIMARILATHLGEALAGTVVIENRPGAGGNIGIGAAAHAEPDGYTLLITSSAYVVNPGLYAKIPYDPYQDFAPIAELGTSPNVILVDPKLGVKTIADLIARAKANPNELNYASPGIGTTPHLSAELLKIEAGIQMTHVPFSGAGPAIQAILSGTTQVAFAALPPAHPHIESGALKALAVTGRAPLVRPAGGADHGRTRLQGFHLRHVPGLSRACEDAALHRRTAVDQVDRNPERRRKLPNSCAMMGSRSSPTGPTA